jgi:stearoyl-CoA desaturase (delta-9 desaturase)
VTSEGAALDKTGARMKWLEIPDAPPRIAVGKRAKSWRDYEHLALIPMVAIHLGALGVFWTGMSASVVILCAALYFVRMFGVTGVHHRYFSHRTYKTSRPMQFLLAFLAQTASQRGVLWWAAHHRDHHRYSDTERDVHSPVVHGFWHSHMGWIFDYNSDTDYAKVKDLARYPELVLLDKLWWLPPVLLGVFSWLVWGWAGLFGGFMLSTVLLWHGTFTINSLSHVWGSRRYVTTDDSRNNWVLALVTMGEGWHNNHHHFMGSTRQGFYWWEIDMSYYVIKAMSWVGLVWDVKEPPARVYEPSDRALPPNDSPREAA